MNHENVMREFRTANFVVRVTAEEDDALDLSFDETGEVARKLENGTFISFCAKAAVLLDGEEIATDYLGGCIYESFDSFMNHREVGKQNRKLAKQKKAARVGSYFSDMIRNVIAEARQEFAAKQKKICSLKLRAA